MTTRAADLALVRALVEKEMQRLRRKKFPHLDACTIRVVWIDRADPERYGEFSGTPLAEYSVYDSGQMNEILLFAKPLIADFGRGARLQKEVRITLLHELGHAIGFDEDDLAARGLD